MGLLGNGAQAEADEVGDERVGVDVVVRPIHPGQGPDERLAQRADQRGGAELDVLGGQLAGRHALAQDVLEAGGVGAAEGEPLDLDGGVDGLGEERPREAPATQGPAREGLDRCCEATGGRPGLGGVLPRRTPGDGPGRYR